MTEFGGTTCDTSNYGYYTPITSRSRPSYTDTSWLTRSERPLHCYMKSLLRRSSGMGGSRLYFIPMSKHTLIVAQSRESGRDLSSWYQPTGKPGRASAGEVSGFSKAHDGCHSSWNHLLTR